jgi:TolB-like protein
MGANSAHDRLSRYGNARAGGGVAVIIRLLGAFEVTSAGGHRVTFPTRKAEALLARLARRPGERIARTRLAGLLWADRPDEQGRGSLRQALAAVRRVLRDAGAPGPTVGGGDVALSPEGIEVDVASLERALESQADLATTLAACRGPLLDGFHPVEDEFDAWVEGERAELARRVLGAIRAALARPGGATDILRLADAGIALDPTFEDGYRARMRVLAAQGDRAGALREYQRCRQALRRDVGVSPAAATEALRREIADGAARSDGPEPRGRPPTLAVLPFEILSTDPAHEIFARGLEEDVLAALSRFRPLRVVAPASSGRQGLAAPAPGEIGRTLDADHLLVASVRAAGGRLRISTRLVESGTGTQLWGDRFEGDLADVFALQDRVTRAVASALVLRIDECVLADAQRRPPERLEAYACWLRGIQCVRRGTPESDLDARRFFEQALSIDPAYARAYSGLSLSYFNDWSCAAWERWDETERRAFEYALEATRLDDRDHVTHCVLGRILLYRREFERAAEHLDRAVALNPNDADMLAHLAIGYAYLGEAERGVEVGLAARSLNPFHPDWYFPCIAANHFVARRPREAVELLERAPDLFVDGRAFMAAAYAHLGEVARARENARRFLERFRSHIARGARSGDDAEPVRWVLHVNPFRRADDRAYLLDGLARAGLVVRAAEAGRDGPPSSAPG